MIDIIYRSKRAFKTKDATVNARAVYEIGEIKSIAGVAIAVTADKVIIDVVCTFDSAMKLINDHWEQAKADAVDKSIDEKLREKSLIV